MRPGFTVPVIETVRRLLEDGEDMFFVLSQGKKLVQLQTSVMEVTQKLGWS